MNRFFSIVLSLLFSMALSAQPPGSAGPYKQPHAHSSGAELLYYCEQTEMVVDQLRCDYYVQAVADLATIPHEGKPMACVPQGQSRSQLMEVALAYLKTSPPGILEVASAASLILKSFQKAFPCPKNVAANSPKNGGTTGYTPQMKALAQKCSTAGDKAAVKQCLDAGLKNLPAETEKTKASSNNYSPEMQALAQKCSTAGDKAAVKKCLNEGRKAPGT